MRFIKYLPVSTLLLLILVLTLTQCDSSVVNPVDDIEPAANTSIKPELLKPSDNSTEQPASVTLLWKEVAGAVQYQVQITETEDFSSTIVDTSTQSSEYNISGLSHEKTYYWKVRAINGDSTGGAWSDSWKFTTGTEPDESSVSTTLEAPENGATDQPADVMLKWANVLNATGYHIQIAQDTSFSAPVTDTFVKTTFYNTSGLSLQQSYYWRVQPQLDSAATRWSETFNFLTGSAPTSSADTVQVTLSAPADGATQLSTSPTLEWESTPEAISYTLQLATGSNFSNPEVETSVQSTSYEASGLDNETTYYWRVMPESESDSDVEKWSEVWDFETKTAPTSNNTGNSPADIWVSAYFACWNHFAPPGGNWGTLPTEEIDWDAFTHLFYFALKARADGSLSSIAAYQNMSPDRINAIVSAAHDAGKPVLFTIGGWGNYDGFSGAISPLNRAVFIANIIATITQWGFDGVDLDMEPIRSGDSGNYIAFVNELHTALQAIDTPLLSAPLLTAATAAGGHVFANIHEKFDQINLMTYDMSGAWQGWVSWHNAPIYNGGLTFPGLSRSLPSADKKVRSYLDAGVPASKIGIGIDFYGYVWSGGSGTSTGGVTRPNQSWSSAPSVTANVPYNKIMDQYYSENRRYWDSDAQAVYLSIDQPGSENDKFISYDDEETIRAKINYIRQKGLGGTIIWELSGGYRSSQPAGSRDNLLQAVQDAVW